MAQPRTLARPPLADTPLGRTIETTATDIWNDSCAVDDLEYALSYGAVGATANPTIVTDVWRADPAHWRDRARELAAAGPSATEVDVAWAVVEDMSVRGAELLLPAFEATAGRQGRLSVQTDPTLYRSGERMLQQAIGFDRLAPNIIVKAPATSVGIAVMEEATFHGVSINATVSISVAQAVAAAEAVERGLRRREAEGLPIDRMGPVITLMMGRMEDWLTLIAEKQGLIVEPGIIAWAGVAAAKRAYAEFQARGLRARLLGAAIRHHRHWSELIGGDMVLTLPASWQRRFNASSIEVRPRFDDPVDPAIVATLLETFPEFRRSYEPDGLSVDEFDTFGPTLRTLRAFVGSYHELLHQVSDAMLPDPDLTAGSPLG